MFEVTHHLALAFAGPVLPADKSLILLVGDGYIAGYFFGSIVLPDVADFQDGSPSPHPTHPDATVEVWRRRWGIVAAIVLITIWAAGTVKSPSDFPIAPADHNLFGAIPLAGIGALLAAMYAPFAARRVVKVSFEASRKQLIPVIVEHRIGERFERVFGGVLAAVYVGVWLNPW